MAEITTSQRRDGILPAVGIREIGLDDLDVGMQSAQDRGVGGVLVDRDDLGVAAAPSDAGSGSGRPDPAAPVTTILCGIRYPSDLQPMEDERAADAG